MKKKDDKVWNKDVYRILKAEDSSLAEQEREAARRLARGHMRQVTRWRTPQDPAGEAKSPGPQAQAAPPAASAPKPEAPKVTVEWHVPTWREIRETLGRWWSSGSSGAPDAGQTPEELVVLVQIVKEEPRFYHWFMILVHSPPQRRKEQIGAMCQELRQRDPALGDAVGLLVHPQWFEAVHRTVRDLRREGEVFGRAVLS